MNSLDGDTRDHMGCETRPLRSRAWIAALGQDACVLPAWRASRLAPAPVLRTQ